MTRTIAITSGKEGVGKTTISLNLALHLAELGFRTCLFDADLGLAGVSTMLGLRFEPGTEATIPHHDLQDMAVSRYEGIDIVHGSSGVERIANLERTGIERMIESLSDRNKYDFILFDTASGASKRVTSFCLASSEVVVVITPDFASLAATHALLKMLYVNGFSGHVKVVVNKSKTVSVAKRAYAKFREVVNEFSSIEVTPLGAIAYDRNVEDATGQQQAFLLLYTELSASMSIESVVEHLVEDRPLDLEESDISSSSTPHLKLIEKPQEETVGEVEEKEIAAGIKASAPEESSPQAESDATERIHIPDNLPMLPHVALKLVEVFNEDDITAECVARVVNKDAALSAKVMRMLNSAGDNLPDRVKGIEEAISSLGIDALRTMAISNMAYSACEQVNEGSLFFLKRFWRHSFLCGVLAKRIALDVSYPAPDEAFLSGLIHDIGKLILWVNFQEDYAAFLQSQRDKEGPILEGEARFGANHCEIGARVIKEWLVQSFITDAVFYHHEATYRIVDALPLVKITFAANALCSDSLRGEAGFEAAREVLGLGRSQAEEMILLAEKEVQEAAEALEIEIDPNDVPGEAVFKKDAQKQKALIHTAIEVSLLQGVLQSLLAARSEEAILLVARQGLQVLFDVQDAVFFILDRKRGLLVGKTVTQNKVIDMGNDLAVFVEKSKSLPATSFRNGTLLDSFGAQEDTAPTIMDRQLIHYLGQEGIVCVPMTAYGTDVGVIAVGVNREEISRLRSQAKFLLMLAGQAASGLAAYYFGQGETNALVGTE